MGMEERLKSCPAGAPDGQQRRPAGQEVAEQHRVSLLEPLQRLRVILLERVTQPVGKPVLVADQVAAPLDQAQ